MLQTAGLDLLIAWAIFFALLAVLAFFILRDGPSEPFDELRRESEADRRNGRR